MGAKENLQLIKARYDAVNKHDFDAFEGFYAGSIVWNDPGLGAPINGARAVRKRLEALVAAFPDLRWNLDRIFAQDDDVCAEFTFTGTHGGALPERSGKSIPATKKAIQIKAVGVYTVRDGKITESRVYFDHGYLVGQLRGEK
jgi:steroid delta-isomerase-like uncharacterized protein